MNHFTKEFGIFIAGLTIMSGAVCVSADDSL